MTLVAPTLDFSVVLSELGQPITIRNITRTINSNGAITLTSNTDTDTNSIVQEVSYKEKTFLQMGIVDVGDIMFFLSPTEVINIYDKIIWNTVTYKVIKILLPPRINATLLYKQILTVRDST